MTTQVQIKNQRHHRLDLKDQEAGHERYLPVQMHQRLQDQEAGHERYLPVQMHQRLQDQEAGHER